MSLSSKGIEMHKTISAGKRKHPITWSWSRTSTPPALHALMSALGERYPIVEDGDGVRIRARLGGEGLTVARHGREAEITGVSVSRVARGIGALLAGCDSDLTERTSFQRVGLMIDCCRNAVPRVAYLKEWLCRAALMGYNQFMLYTKDTYELPGEEIFGYLRGRYTADELRELDAYAASLGIEIVGCVQALGHLEPVLRWGRYAAIKDTSAELLTTEEQSYALIDKILDFYASVYRSRRIHLGMDETHGLGRGRYLDLNGYRRPFDIYIDHLNRVVNACVRRGLEPLIWSDMFFRMGSRALNYYDPDAVTPPEIIAQIPPSARLTYWDYYHTDGAFYREWIRRHRALGQNPVMASGIWTWLTFWYNHQRTVETVRPCVESCAQEGVEEIFFTMWGDDGGYCDWSSAQAGACYAAEKVFNPVHEPDEALLADKFAAICGGDFAAHLTASRTTAFNGDDAISAPALLWDDPLLGIYRKDRAIEKAPDFWPRMAAHYQTIAARLRGLRRGGAGDLRLAQELASLLADKIETTLAVEQAPRAPGTRQRVLALARQVERFERHYRAVWYARNKPQGYEVMQIRLAGQAARWRELGRRLQDLADGICDSIPELTERPRVPALPDRTYKSLATASVYL
jgi:hexosaminidase